MKTIFDIANWFLANNNTINNKKLQFLTYLTYGWSLALFNESKPEIKFFNTKFEAWEHGPVCPELYDKYKEYGSSNIPKYNGTLVKFSEDELDLLKQINKMYGMLFPEQLELFCMFQQPYMKTKNNLSPYETSHDIIKDKDIFKYFKKINKLIGEL